MSRLTPRLLLLLSCLLCSGVLVAEHFVFGGGLKVVDVEFEGDQVNFAYVGGKLPDLLESNEVREKRTEFSYTVYEGTDEAGNHVYHTRVYTQPTFVQDGLAWHGVEYGKATIQQFAELTRPTTFQKLARVIATPTYAVQVLGDNGDEGIANQDNAGWSATQGAAAGDEIQSDACIGCNGASPGVGQEGDFIVSRAFFPFNTGASIPADATITAASLNLYAESKGDDDPDANAFISVVQTSQADYSSIVFGDFDQCGSSIDNPTEGIDVAERKDIGSDVTTSAYVVFDLNATGMGWIAKTGDASACHSSTTGITCIGVREGHDITDTAYNGGDGGFSIVDFKTAETTGTSNDPYLDVTYTSGDAPTVTTSAASGVTSFNATLNGNITDDGGAAATTCGFAWGTDSGLSNGDTATTTDSTCPGSTGAFTKSLSSLLDNTTYYFRAYATNTTGTGYGTTIESFSTGVSKKIRLYGRVQLFGGTHLR